MSETAYFGKRGELRCYSNQSDGAGGVYYFQVAFMQMDFVMAAGRMRPPEIPVLDRGLITSYSHYIQGPDNDIITPVQITWNCTIDNTINRRGLRQALSNPDRDSPWLVNGQPFANTNGTTTMYNGFGSVVSCLLPFDTLHDRINVQVLWRGVAAGADDYGFTLNETWFHAGHQRITEAPEAIKFGVTGFVYGSISSILAFSPGTDVSR